MHLQVGGFLLCIPEVFQFRLGDPINFHSLIYGICPGVPSDERLQSSNVPKFVSITVTKIHYYLGDSVKYLGQRRANSSINSRFMRLR